MNANERERQLRGWLDARDPGEAPARLRAAVAEVPYATRRSIFPALDAAMARVLGPSALASQVVLLVVLVTLVVALVGGALLLRSESIAPRGLIAYVAPLDSPGATGISLVAADGTGGRRVTAVASNIFEHSPRWSADGRTLLFARTTDLDPFAACGGVGSIVLYDVATATEQVLATDLRPLQELEWSPSGEQVAFVHPPAGCGIPGEIGIVDVASHRITTSPLETVGAGWDLRWVAGAPSVSEVDALRNDVPTPDGKLEADCGGVVRDPTHRLLISDRQTKAQIDLGPGLAGSWSPDGSAIAFIQPTDQGPPAQFRFQDQLVVAGVGTWQVRVVSAIETTQLAAPELRWTPDGRAIYWIDGQGGHVVDVASGRAVDLPPIVNGSTDLSWQPLPGA